MRYYPQGPVATGSFVFDDGDEDRVARVLHALPYQRSGARVRIRWLREHPGTLDAVHDVFGHTAAVVAEELENEEFNDKIQICYMGQPSPELPSPPVTVDTIGRFPGPPVVKVVWGSERKDRDIECDDVFSHYVQVAQVTQCRCSVLAVEDEILKMDNEFVFPIKHVCAITFGRQFAKSGDANFEALVSEIRRSIGTIAGCRCRLE